MATALRLVGPPAKRHKGVQCEHCETRRMADINDTISQLREQLRQEGWLCRLGVDVCPPCRAKGMKA